MYECRSGLFKLKGDKSTNNRIWIEKIFKSLDLIIILSPMRPLNRSLVKFLLI